MSATKNTAAEPRYELKMSCEERAYPLVLAQLRLHHAGIRTLYPSRLVQSVYLDTHDSRALSDNLAGISERHKLRLRWYGPDTRQVHGTLERKNRENMLGTKDTLELAEPIDVEGTTRLDFARRLRQLATPEWRRLLEGDMEPALWVAYDRDYLTTADHVVRVTVDRSLRFADQRYRVRLSPDRPTPTPRLLVVEFKAPLSARERLEELVQEMPMRVDRCSKFVLGTSPLHGPPSSWLGW